MQLEIPTLDELSRNPARAENLPPEAIAALTAQATAALGALATAMMRDATATASDEPTPGRQDARRKRAGRAPRPESPDVVPHRRALPIHQTHEPPLTRGARARREPLAEGAAGVSLEALHLGDYSLDYSVHYSVLAQWLCHYVTQ